MNHNTRTGLIAGASSLVAIVVVILAPQAIADLGGGHLPPAFAAARLYLVPLLTYVAAWAGHYLVTRDPEPPLPSGFEPSHELPPPLPTRAGEARALPGTDAAPRPPAGPGG